MENSDLKKFIMKQTIDAYTAGQDDFAEFVVEALTVVGMDVAAVAVKELHTEVIKRRDN